MPKDKRNKKVALKQEETAAAPKKRRKKKKASPSMVFVRVLLAIFLVTLLVFLFVVGKYLYSYFFKDDGYVPTVPIDYETTSDEDIEKVSYYLVGLMGERSTDPLEMLSLLCFDKKAGTLDVLQIPVSTYLGKFEGWNVTAVGSAWSDPKPLTWCDRCRKRVYAPEVSIDNTHTVCGETLTTKKGSSTENLIDICNDQYSMPVDAFFILPQQALVKLVDRVGGVDVQLSSSITVNDIKYAKGVQTLDGEAALYYAVSAGYKSTPATDLVRLEHQRQVFTALFLRMAQMSEEDLHDDVIDPIMSGSTPIRVNETVKGRYAMVAGVSDRKAEDIDYERAISILIKALGKLQLKDMQYHILPGESAKANSVQVYGVHADALLTLLSEQFNPYGREILLADLKVTELKNSGKSDAKTASWDTIALEQKGEIDNESSKEDSDD